MSTSYDATTHTVTIYATRIPHGRLEATSLRKAAGEKTLDAASLEGIINFGTAAYATHPVAHVVLIDRTQAWTFMDQRNRGLTVRTPMTNAPTRSTVADLPVPTYNTAVDTARPAAGTTTAASTTGAGVRGAISLPPTGVRMDPSITPIAPLSASSSAKVAAVEQVAQSKLGTPYIWGHNEDRGQYGFDCSNYTEYVYHHALGYLFTTSSKGQYLSVGVPLATSQMLPGDLLTFDKGGHTGIYVGNGRMIQEGGGLKKVGYLPLSPGSYWYNHLSAVKRMF